MSDIKPIIKELIDRQDWRELRKQAWSDWPIPDTADAVIGLDKSDRVLFFRILPREISAEVFSYLDKEQKNTLLKDLSDEETRILLANLRPDDRTTLFEELPGQATQRLLNLLSPQDLKEACLLLGYPEESVGRLMTPDYVAIRPYWTIEEALRRIRVKGKKSETLNTIYVTDDAWKLLDAIELHRLILADPQSKVEELMGLSFVRLSAFEDRENAVHTMQKYDVFALPVVDSGGVLIGVVTFDDVMDVAQEEATEDFHKGAAVAPLKMSYQEATVPELYRKRIGWLMILAFVGLLSSGVIAVYEDTLHQIIALAVFIPLLMGSGGNAGAQSATLMVRALAIGDVYINQWFKVFVKEIVVGAFLGVSLGLLVSMFGYVRGGMEIGLIVGLTMMLVIVAANIIGMTLPFLLTSFGIDPAVASNPLITSITDVLGLLIYFAVAGLIIGVF